MSDTRLAIQRIAFGDSWDRLIRHVVLRAAWTPWRHLREPRQESTACPAQRNHGDSKPTHTLREQLFPTALRTALACPVAPKRLQAPPHRLPTSSPRRTSWVLRIGI